MKNFGVQLGFTFFEEDNNYSLPLRNPLIDTLDAVKKCGSLSGATKELNVSFRHLWNELNRWEERLGVELIERGRGKNCRLSPIGEKLLLANKEAQAEYLEQIIDLKTRISQTFSKAFKEEWNPIKVGGCTDVALDQLLHLSAFSDCELDVVFSSSLRGLQDLNSGIIDLAGFNLPSSSSVDSEAAKEFLPYLDQDKISLISFSTRLQGIVTAKDNPQNIHSLLDIVLNQARFINREKGTGTRILLDQLLAASGINSQEIIGYDNISASASLTAVAIDSGKADVGICTANLAKEFDLNFIPLVKESYYLACKKDFPESISGKKFLSFLGSIDCTKKFEKLTGYDFGSLGKIQSVNEIFA